MQRRESAQQAGGIMEARPVASNRDQCCVPPPLMRAVGLPHPQMSAMHCSGATIPSPRASNQSAMRCHLLFALLCAATLLLAQIPPAAAAGGGANNLADLAE